MYSISIIVLCTRSNRAMYDNFHTFAYLNFNVILWFVIKLNNTCKMTHARLILSHPFYIVTGFYCVLEFTATFVYFIELIIFK